MQWALKLPDWLLNSLGPKPFTRKMVRDLEMLIDNLRNEQNPAKKQVIDSRIAADLGRYYSQNYNQDQIDDFHHRRRLALEDKPDEHHNYRRPTHEY